MPTQSTPEAKEDYNALLGALMPFAEDMLKKHGEFYPFGAAVNAAGEVSAHAADTGEEMPESQQVIALLVKGLQAEAREGKIRATGICSDGRIIQDGKKVDAVIVSLEHVSGNASKACVPYSKGIFGKYRFGEMLVSLDEQKIFGT
jgi:hypothetical protein